MSRPLTLIAEINRACDQLGLLRAELARILGLMCHDVSDSRELEKLLLDTNACQKRARRFIHLYSLLEQHFNQDSVAIINWFRKHHTALNTSPFLALVDEDRIEDIIQILQP